MTNKFLSRLQAVGLAALLIGIAGCSSTPDRTSGQVMNDRQTARRVKKELDNAPTYKYPDVKVNSFDGNIQLTGFAETESQRLSAAEVAASTRGVKQVINQIMLKPAPTGRMIRDPLGDEAGKLLLYTNVPASKVEPVPNPNP